MLIKDKITSSSFSKRRLTRNGTLTQLIGVTRVTLIEYRLPVLMRRASLLTLKETSLFVSTILSSKHTQTRLLCNASKQQREIPRRFQTRFLLLTAFHGGLCLSARTQPFSKRSKGPRPHLENINELPAVNDIQRTYKLRAPRCIRLSRKGAASR